MATGALASDASGMGPALAARREVGPVAVRLAGQARFGDALAGRTTQIVFAGGVAMKLYEVRRFSVGARLDGILDDELVTRASLTRSRFVGGADLVAEAALRLTPSLSIVAGVGGEAVFGATPIRVGAAREGELGPLRAIAELGARARF
jgi:hypothetical protein